MEKTTLYLPKELQVELRAAARRERRSQADIVRDAVTEYLTKRPRPLPKSIGIIDDWPDDGVDSSNIKEWLREQWAREAQEMQGHIDETWARADS